MNPVSSDETPTPHTDGLSKEAGDLIAQAYAVTARKLRGVFDQEKIAVEWKKLSEQLEKYASAARYRWRIHDREAATSNLPLETEGGGRSNKAGSPLTGSSPPVSSSPVLTATDSRENKEESSGWIRTALRPPTKEDGDYGGYVLWGDQMFGSICAPFDKWINDKVEGYRYWMRIPPVPKE